MRKYTVLASNKYNKSIRKIIKSSNFSILEVDECIKILQEGIYIPEKYKNHKLHGKYTGLYECHIRPDILLIYEKDEKEKILILINIGSHSELFR